MARTTHGLVLKILLTDYDSKREPSLDGFIDTASSIVDDLVACLVSNGLAAYPSPKLELIERWLTAHCYCMSDPQYKEKKTFAASGKFMGKDGKGFEQTRYGQTAISLDPSGCLAALGNSEKIALLWLGKTPAEQIDYEDRD